jgi:GNAT superfamily N-acetyltransferase/anti-sigma regulatory factor (Ser/Thr protein kinase)
LNPEEFRKRLIEMGESDEEILAAGFDPEKFKVYTYLVPETIYEEGPKTALTPKDIEYIDAVMKRPEEDGSIPQETLLECRSVLERALLLFGLERVRSVYLSNHFRRHNVSLVARTYDINEYAKAVLDLKSDIAEIDKDMTFVMDDSFIAEDGTAPVLDGKKTDRVRNPNYEKMDFTLGQKTWGNFEMFISKDRSTVYVSSVERGSAEYFSINMDMAAPHPLMYHSGDLHIALDASIPAASLNNGHNINMARIIGILREAIGFREEVVKHDRSDYYWIDRLGGRGNELVSYDILAAHKIPHLMEFVGPHALIPDLYALNEKNRLELLAEFGRHSPAVLGKKFAYGYYAIVSVPQGRRPTNEKFPPAEELILSASMPDKFLRSPAQFQKSASVIAEEFLANLRILASEEDMSMPVPRSIMVEDSYGNMKIRFELDPVRKVIISASAVEMVRTISQKDLRTVFMESESIITSRTGMVDISKVRPSKLMRYGYAKIVGSNGNIVIAPVEGMIQRPMPRNWAMGLPFTSLAVSLAGKRSVPDKKKSGKKDAPSPKREVVFAIDLPASTGFDDDVRESEKIYEFLDGFEQDHKGKLGGLLEDVLEELIFNVTDHGRGGKMVIYMEKDADGEPAAIEIVTTDNGPGLPDSPDDLVKKSLLAHERFVNSPDDEPEPLDDGIDYALMNAYRGQGFARIALDPDSVTIECNGLKYSRSTNDKNASSWFGEPVKSEVTTGARFTLGFSLRSEATHIPSIPVDRRPVDSGLLASSFVEYDMDVKETVNPDNKPIKALYCASGADLSNFLLSTNATEGYFVSHYRGRFRTMRGKDLRECFESASPEDYIKKNLSPYYREKFERGFAGTETFYSMRQTIAAMAFELKSIGVDLSTVKIDTLNGRPVLRFRWKYYGCDERDYSVVLIDADATKPEEYAADLAGVAMDVYYQRAGNELPMEYRKGAKSYIGWIYARMKPGAYVVTDDNAFDNAQQWYRDLGGSFPLPAKEVDMPELWPIEWVILRALRPMDIFNHEAAFYGWRMTVRQKPIDAEMVTDDIGNLVKVSKRPFLARIVAYLRGKGISERWIASLGGLEELFFSGIVISAFAAAAPHIFAISFSAALYTGFGISAVLFTLSHIKEVYRMTGGVLTTAPPSASDMIFITGLGMAFRAAYLAGLALLPFGPYNIAVALPLIIVLHSIYNAFIAPRSDLVLGMASVNPDKPFKELTRINSSIATDTTALINQLSKSFSSAYLIMNPLRNIKAGLARYGYVKRTSLESCRLGIRRILATWHLSETKKKKLSAALNRIDKILAKMDRMDGMIDGIELLPRGVSVSSVASGLNICVIRLKSILEGIREEDVHLIERLEGISASIHEMAVGHEEINSEKLIGYVKAFKAISTHQGVGDKSRARISRLADDMSALLASANEQGGGSRSPAAEQIETSLFDSEDMSLIDRMWIAMPVQDGRDWSAAVEELQSRFSKDHPGDLQVIEEGASYDIDERVSDRLVKYVESIGGKHAGDVHIMTSTISAALQNVYQHGDNYGAMILRARRMGRKMEVEFVIIDCGQGFIDRQGKHVDIHEAVKYGKSFGANGQSGIGLTITVEVADSISITTVDRSSGSSEAYYWEKGDVHESRLKTAPVESGSKIVFTREVDLTPEPDDPKGENVAVEPAAQSVDIVKWYFEEYEPSQVEMAASFNDGTLTGDHIIEWVDRVVRPLKPDLDVTGIVETGKPFTPRQAGLLGEKILKDVLIPHGIIAHVSAVASGVAVGSITNTETITTPAGRTIPLYTVRTLRGEFGQGTAFAEYVIVPEEIAKESHEIADHYAKLWRDHMEGRAPAALFRYQKRYAEWIFMHLFGKSDAAAAARLVRECDLAEELSHSDMQAFAETVLERPLDTAVPEDVEAASHAILKPASIEELAFEAARDGETRYILAEAVLEVEAKLNAIIRSPMSAYNFLEFLHGNVVDLHIPGDEPPEYNVARNILLSVMSKHLFGKSTTDTREWRDYLDETLWNMDEFNAALKKAAAAAYREEFLSHDERVKKAEGYKTRRRHTELYTNMYRELVRPRFALGAPKVLNICSGAGASAILYATNCSSSVMIDRLSFGYNAGVMSGRSERTERERYFNDIAQYDFPRTDTLTGIGSLWLPLKWELAEMGIGEDAITVDNPAYGTWRVRFTWQHPDDDEARERTLWFYQEDIPESSGVADLSAGVRLDAQKVDILDADILFDRAAEHTLRATTDMPLYMKRKSIVITDNPVRKNIFDTQDSLVPVTLDPALSEQSSRFGYVGKNTYEKHDALDAMAVYEVRGSSNGFSGDNVNIYSADSLTGEERDRLARFVIREGLDISTTYIGEDERGIELGRAYLDRLTRKNESGESGYFVAFKGGDPVGIVSYAVLPGWLAAEREYESTIDDLYVTGSVRNQGIAADLVRQAETHLRKKNVKNYYVVVGQGAPSQDFWKKFIPREYQTVDDKGELFSSIVPFENPREIARVEACIKAVKAGAFQNGNVVDLRRIPPDMEVIIVGDLHARVDNLGNILEHADPGTGKSVYEKVRDGEAVLILLGDVVNNDPPDTENIAAIAERLSSMEESVDMIKKVMDLKISHPDSVYYVLGNHDDPFSMCNRGGIDQSRIYRDTIRSRYGERYLYLYNDLIQASPVMVIAEGLVATHAAPIRRLSLENIINADKDSDEIHFGMWGRHESHFGDLVDISEDSSPLRQLLYQSRREQSYDSRDVVEFLDRVGQKDGVFIVGHTPDLIPEGDFHAEIEDRHHIIYAARDKTGYASFTAGKLDFVETSAVEMPRVERSSPTPSSGLKLADKVLLALPIEEQQRVDAVVRFAAHVMRLSGIGDADLEKEAAFDAIPASTVAAFMLAERDKDAKLDSYDESWEADAIIFLGHNHPLFKDTKVTPKLSIRVLFEMRKRGMQVSEYCISMCDSVDKLVSFLLNGPLEEKERMARATLMIEELGMKDLIPWSAAALDRISLYAEWAGTPDEARVACSFLEHFTGHLFESRAMADAFMFNLSVVEGFLGPGNINNKDTGVVYLLGGASLLYDQARQIALSLKVSPSRIHPFSLNRKTAESDDETIREYIKQEGLDRYKNLVIVDTGFHGSMARRLKDVLGSMPNSPRNVHARLLAMSSEPYEYKGMDVLGYNHVLQEVDPNWSEIDRNALFLITHLLDNIFPKREQSPGRLDTANVLVAVTPVTVPSEVPGFAAIVSNEMRLGTGRLLSRGFEYPDPGNSVWERWIPSGKDEMEGAPAAEIPDLLDSTVRGNASYGKLKQELTSRFTRLGQKGVSLDSVEDVLDENSVEIFQAMWGLRNIFTGSKFSDERAQTDMCYEVSVAVCEAFDEAVPGHEIVLMSGYYDDAGGGLFRIPHFWVVIDGDIAIDLTYGQFDSEYEDTALVVRTGELPRYKLEQGKVAPWKSAPRPQTSVAATISAIHYALKTDASHQAGSRILLSASLFDDIDRSNLERLFNGTNIEIVEPEELKRRTMNEHSSKENLAVVLTQEDFTQGKTWSGAEDDYRVKSSVLILGDKLTGSNYLYLEGVIELARAMMRSDRNGIKEAYELISGAILSDEALSKLGPSPNTIAFAINAILKFRPIVVHDTGELERFKSMVERYLINA